MKPKFYKPNKSETRGFFNSKPIPPAKFEDIKNIFVTTDDIFELVRIENRITYHQYIVYCKEKNIWNGHSEDAMDIYYVTFVMDYNKFWAKFNEN